MRSFPYTYYTNGFYIASELSFPELEDATGTPTAFISYGQVPEKLENPTFESPYQQANQEEYLLDVKNAARYWLKNNNEIIVQPYENVQIDDVRVYVLSILMGVLLHKHNLLPIHSCCIKVNEAAVLIAGDSGAGKSTISLGLYRKGYEILNDDISTVFLNEEKTPFVHPGYKHLKLWSESLEKYGYAATDYRKLRSEIEKYSFPINRSSTLAALPVKAVIILNPNADKELSFEPISGVKAFDTLNKNTFGRNLLKILGKEASHFKLCSAVATKVKVIKVNRPEGTKPAEFADYMEELIKTI